MKNRDLDGQHRDSDTITKLLGKGDQGSVPDVGRTFQFDVAVIGVSGTEPNGGQHVGSGHTDLLLVGFDLFFEQAQLRTRVNVGTQLTRSRNGYQGIGRNEFRIGIYPDNAA